MRLFLALYPPQEVREYIRDFLRHMAKEKRNLLPANIDQVHLTANFFGAKVSVSSKQKIAKELMRHAGSYPAPTIEILGTQLGFYRQQRPRTIFMDVKDDYDLHEFIDSVHADVRKLKLRDTIRWKAKDIHDHHISIARLKDAAVTKSTITRVKDLMKNFSQDVPEPFTVHEAYLVESVMTNKGPIYKKMEMIKLSDSGNQ